MNSTKNTLSPTISPHQNRVLKQIDNRSEEKVTVSKKEILKINREKINVCCNPKAKKSV
ncbi:MAG TPA: hypothetical protein VF571_13335 [Pyrinomonadaceae bacterium]|jgi:hypothetical protein